MTAAARLRPAAIFLAVAVLGIALAALLGRGPAPPGGGRPRLPVVPVPGGTDVRGAAGIPGVSLVGAKGIVASEVRTVDLDDGASVPFRPSLLLASSERPLPSPAPGVRRVALEDPELLLVPEPKTRKEYEDSAAARPTRLAAPRGILDQGPGDASSIRLIGGARMEAERRGVPWTFEGDEALVSLPSRDVHCPGPVSIESPELRMRGRVLDLSESRGTIRVAEGASGTVARSGGVRFGGGAGGGEIRFSGSGPCEIRSLPAEGGRERHRIALERDAVLEQGDGRLTAPRIEVDLARAPGPEEEGLRAEEIRAEGGALLTGGREGSDFASRAGRLRARPRPDGSTDVHLEGEPSLDLRERDGAAEKRLLRVEGRGPADLRLPRDAGDVRAEFRGGATAVLREPPAEDGAPPAFRTLRARTLHLEGNRPAPSARTEIREVRAEGEAEAVEGDRHARARTIAWTPSEGGGSRTVLRGDFVVSWLAAGSPDPLAAAAGGGGAGDAEGTLLLAGPGEALVDSPAGGDASRGASIAVRGGATLRRVRGEQEVYRLTSSSLNAALHPGNRGFARLDAAGDARLEGREEGPQARRYDFRGERLVATGAPGTGEARTAEVLGIPGGTRAFASFLGEDGRPMTVAADRLRMDRETGALHAEGSVRGTGILPEAPGTEGPATARGAAEIACPVLDGLLEPGTRPGTSRLKSLDARDDVWIRTETQYASGRRLSWEPGSGAALLSGGPARVTSRSPAAKGLEDLCEAPEIRIRVREGRIEEARADGGRIVSHRAEAAAAGAKEAPPPERLEARCGGPLLHAPAATTLERDVAVVRQVLRDGSFVEKDRIEGADRARVSHPPGPDGSAGRLEAAEASSDGAGLSVISADGWKATGVSRVVLAADGRSVVLESSARFPRFRVEGGGAVQSYRRVVYDYDRRIFTEQVGASVEGGR